MRIGGKKPAIITLVIDLLRGIILVALARYFSSDTIAVLTGLAIFIGNIYPVFFEFKGGKGVATGCGVLFSLYWTLGLAVGLTWLAVFKKTNISSLSVLVSAILMPIYAWLIIDQGIYCRHQCTGNIIALA